MKWAWTTLALLCLCAARRADAASGSLPVDLEWDAPGSCPDASVVTRRVAELLEGRRPPTSRAFARAEIRSDGGRRYELTLRVRTESAEDTRTVSAASCAALAEASAVVIALAISLPTESPTESTPAAPEPPPPTSPPSPSPKTPPREAAKRSATRPGDASTSRSTEDDPPRFAFGLGSALGTGALPSLGAGFGASASLRLRRLRVGVLGTLWLRQRPYFDANAGATFDMVEVGGFGCYMVPIRIAAFGPCANIEASFVRVEGFGIRAPRGSWSNWPTLVAGAKAELRLHRLVGAFARADLTFPVDPPLFTLGSTGVHLHEPATVGTRFGLGVEIVLP